jgi:hypothetical protein
MDGRAGRHLKGSRMPRRASRGWSIVGFRDPASAGQGIEMEARENQGHRDLQFIQGKLDQSGDKDKKFWVCQHVTGVVIDAWRHEVSRGIP